MLQHGTQPLAERSYRMKKALYYKYEENVTQNSAISVCRGPTVKYILIPPHSLILSTGVNTAKKYPTPQRASAASGEL